MHQSLVLNSHFLTDWRIRELFGNHVQEMSREQANTSPITYLTYLVIEYIVLFDVSSVQLCGLLQLSSIFTNLFLTRYINILFNLKLNFEQIARY